MEVREIELGDLFVASKLLKKIDLKRMIKEVGISSAIGLDDEQREKALKDKALDVVNYLMEHLDEAETEILTLIGGWCGIDAKAAKKIKLSEIKTLTDEFVRVNGQDTIIRFFKRAAGLVQQ